MVPVRSDNFDDAAAVGIDGVPEKAPKGCAISNLALESPVSFIVHSKSTISLTQEGTGKCTRAFRQRKIALGQGSNRHLHLQVPLRDLLIKAFLARNLSSVPLEDRDPDTPAIEELRELVRIQR